MVLTEEQLQKFDAEIKQRGMGIDPAKTFQDEADSYSYTPETTAPEQETPEQLAKPIDLSQNDFPGGNVDIVGTDEIETSSMAMPVAEGIVKFTTNAADNIKKTNIYKRATYTKEDVLREAKEINIETGIPVSSILYNAETLDNARNIYNYRRKQMEMMMPGENEVSVNGLMEAYPGFDKIINSGNEVDGAIALQNIKNVKQINSIFEAIKAKGQAGWIGYKMGEIGAKPIREGRGITEEEFAKYDEYVKQINDMKQLPTFYEDPFMNIVGSTAEQLPRQISGSVTGVLYGTAAAATAAGATALTAPLTGGTSLAAVPVAAKTGFRWGMRAGYVVDMFENSAGQRYIEYSRMKDENGKRVLNDEEARAYAVVMGAIEAGIEFANFDLVLRALKGNKSIVADQVRNAVAGALDSASLRKSLGVMLKNGGMITLSESVEEGVTEAADRIGSTIVSNLKNNTSIPRYTPGQVVEGFFEKTFEAIPASVGFAGMAVGSSSLGFVRRAAAFAEWKDNNVREQIKNQSGISMMKDMVENADIKSFFKKDPDVAKQVLKNTVAGTGYEKVNIDTEMVARQENGLVALRDIGERAGMSVEEVQTAIETGADLTVPTEVYFQMRAENENFVIKDDYIAFSDVAPSFARNKYYAEMKKAEIDTIMKDANTRQLEQQMAAIDMIVQDNFAEGIERDAAAAVLTMRPDNPIEGLKEMRGMYKEQLDSILAPVIRELEKGMKQGVDNVRIEGGKDGRDDSIVRVSNNADWARKFYAENKRWPTRFELEGMAIDILSGRDFSKLADYQNVPDMQEFYDANASQIDELLGNIEAFDNIEERIANIDATDLQTMEGMSREAYEIYKRESSNAIANAPNDAVKRAAKMGAALLARHADRYAQAKRDAGEKNYTAADYYRDLINVKYGGTFRQPQNEQYFQVSPAEFERQKAEVRSRYENTDQWLKAPNGKDTNLTEDQWVTVRTDAFKNWFGDWENDPQNASKVVDRNGEPLVVYHGSKKKFDTFEKQKIGTGVSKKTKGGNHFGNGFYFADNYFDARKFGRNVIEAFLVIKNPALSDLTVKENNDGIFANGFNGREYIAFEPNQIKDATGRNVGFDPQSGNIYLQMAGENALNAPLEKLQEAKKMEQDGADEADIWKQTGWIKGKDNRWRFEIQDNLRNINFSNLVENGNAMLPDVYGNSLLYEAYPQLANIPVVADKNIDGDKNGYYDPATGIIHVSDNLLKNNETRAKENLVHEIQHVIQGIERFAMGGSPETITRQLIIEFDNVEHEMRKISEDAFAYFNRKKDFELAQLYFISGKITEQEFKDAEEKLATFEKYSSLTKEQKEEIRKLGNRRNTLIKQYKLAQDNPTEAYWRLAGEQEARETASRARYRAGRLSKLDDDIKAQNEALKELKSVASKMTKEETEAFERFVALDKETDADKLPDNYSDVMTELGEKIPQNVREAYYDYQMATWVKDDEFNYVYGPGEVPQIHNNNSIVIFGDAVENANTFFQRQQAMNDTIQGATEFKDNGMRVITVFDSGNESTIAHELGHVFVADLKALAEMQNAPEQITKDWETIKKWLGYKSNQTKFTTAQQEKFARGFEAYLRTGEAPAQGLRKVFQNFKNWLCKIYKDFLSLGGKPSDDVRAVMGRMLATEEEVEQAFKMREAEEFERAGGLDYLAKDSLEMYKRWQKDAQEYAKEKVLKEAMKNLTEQRAKELELVREKMTEDIRTQLLSTPVYRAEMILDANPKLANDWPAEMFGMTYEEYTEAIKEQGTLEEATKKAVDLAMAEVEEGLPLEEIKKNAEEAVSTSEYRGMYLAFEDEFITKKKLRDDALNKRIEQALADIEKAASGIGKEKREESKTVQNLRQKIKDLKYQARWTAAEADLIRKIELAAKDAEIAEAKQRGREQASEIREQKNAEIAEVQERVADLRKERNEKVKELRKAIADFRSLFNQTRNRVRVYRDTAVNKYKLVKEYAKENMAEMNVDDATNVSKWIAMEKRAGRESVEALKKALDAELKYRPEEKGLVTTEPSSEERLPGESRNAETVDELWQKAAEAKLRQRVFAEYAALATRNKAKVQRRNAILQKRQKTIEKNNNIPANERYMYVHGLYVLGLSKVDAQMPQGEPNILGMFKEYSENLEMFFVDEDGNVSLPDYIISALSGNTVYNDGYTNLTMEQYDEFADLLTAIYKAGIDANKIKSMKDPNGNTALISDVAETIVAEMNARIPAIVKNDITNAGSMTFTESIQDKARWARVQLTKPETILEWMGPTAHRYIYETINQSWNKEQLMLEQQAVAIKAIWSPYTNDEKSEMRSKRQFRFGTSILTREEMICVAFNWGTEINRRRIMDGFNVDESTVRELLSNLTQKDWQMVTSVWDLVNSYWPETVKVEESMVGVAPKKQSAMPFEIMGKDGNVYKLSGGYYPIKYDPTKSLTAANQAQEDVAKQIAGGNAAMNRNRGFMKQRTQQKVSRPVKLSFDVLNKHLNEVVHNICFRECLRDTKRLINHADVIQSIQDHFGIHQAKAFQKWVEHCWAPEIENKDAWAKSLEFFRHKQTAAALGYRATTALLNTLNIFPITDYLGTARTLDALQKFYSNPKENWNFALDRSIFLRERAETMDRDAGEVLRKEFIGGYGKVADTIIRGEKAIEAHAFDMLAVTDLALACPLWLSEYQRVYQENKQNLAEMTPEAIERLEMEAVSAGDKAVRKIFGSGEMKDLAPVQKGGEITKAVSMFYSYFNVVFNALYGGYAQGRQQAMTEGATTVLGQSLGIRIAPLVRKLVFWTLFTGVVEGLERSAVDYAAGGSDDPEEWIKKMVKGVSDNIFGTIPILRDGASMFIDKLMGERYFGAKPMPAYQLFDTGMKLWNTIESKKKTKIDVFREGMRVTSGFTGIGNTLTDAMATTAYWVDTDFDRPFMEYLAAVIFDKRIDKKRKKK